MKTSKIIEVVMLLFKRKPKPEDVIYPELLAFLEEKGILKEFMNNYNNIESRRWRENTGSGNCVCNIRDAFYWAETPQGRKYWEYLEKQFKKI